MKKIFDLKSTNTVNSSNDLNTPSSFLKFIVNNNNNNSTLNTE